VTDSRVVVEKKSIAEALDGHRNAFGLLRLFFAALVLVNHAFPLGGFGEDPLWGVTRGQASFGAIAVLGFFAISGYLIAKSGMSTDVVTFLWRRVLRIFPGYWLVLIVAAFVVGPLIWTLDGNQFLDYFHLGGNGPAAYFANNWTLQIGTYAIYDIFATTTPYGHVVHASVLNGSLWTLLYEFQCYLMIAVFVAFAVLSRARLLVPLAAVFMAGVQLLEWANPKELASLSVVLSDSQRIPLTFAFLAGSSLAVYSRKVIFDDRLGVLALIVVLLTLHYGGFAILGTAAGAYFILYLAARLPARLKRVGQKNDYSYGVYVYGFLVQQVLAYFGVYRLGFVVYLLAATAVTFGLAWVSWHLVEKRAMSLKDWGPGRGWHYWRGRVGLHWSDWRSRRRPTSGTIDKDFSS
jgi:peptidoglycan/LPS O-acetylase OafA/YrhL